MSPRNPILLGALTIIFAGPALAQQSPVSAPPPGEADSHALPGLSSPKTIVKITPDRSATSMADPQSAALFGSPSAVESPSSAMPNPEAWPTIHRSAKRPSWVKKAPAPGAESPSSPPPVPH